MLKFWFLALLVVLCFLSDIWEKEKLQGKRDIQINSKTITTITTTTNSTSFNTITTNAVTNDIRTATGFITIATYTVVYYTLRTQITITDTFTSNFPDEGTLRKDSFSIFIDFEKQILY